MLGEAVNAFQAVSYTLVCPTGIPVPPVHAVPLTVKLVVGADPVFVMFTVWLPDSVPVATLPNAIGEPAVTTIPHDFVTVTLAGTSNARTFIAHNVNANTAAIPIISFNFFHRLLLIIISMIMTTKTTIIAIRIELEETKAIRPVIGEVCSVFRVG